MRRTLILTTAISYRWPDLAPFLVSLRRTGSVAEVVLLVEDKWLHADDRAQFQAAGARTWPVYPRLSRVPHQLRQLRFRQPIVSLHRLGSALASCLPLAAATRHRWSNTVGASFHPIMSARAFLYRDVLAAVAGRYDRVLLCDSRDVVFQSDPAAWISASPLDVFLEPARATIGSEPNNARWIRRLFGEDCLDALAAKRVSCAGVVSGTFAGITTYLDALTAEFHRLTVRIAGENGFDQGVHNFLVHTGRLPGVRIWENGHGLALNMQGLTDAEISPDDAGAILHTDGTPVPLLHQYDRHPRFRDAVLRGLGLPTPAS